MDSPDPTPALSIGASPSSLAAPYSLQSKTKTPPAASAPTGPTDLSFRTGSPVSRPSQLPFRLFVIPSTARNRVFLFDPPDGRAPINYRDRLKQSATPSHSPSQKTTSEKSRRSHAAKLAPPTAGPPRPAEQFRPRPPLSMIPPSRAQKTHVA